MNFGSNIQEWLQGQLLPILFVIIIVGALLLAWKRSFSALIGFLVFMGIIGVIVSSPEFLVELGKKLWGIVFA